ncbi:hypothetical protein AGR7B_Lc40051 [Agrobacterium deltaense RV3]|nr:hypothetical protein AGR7B_Lc40051 [Agrobacterium deltaense RV3]
MAFCQVDNFTVAAQYVPWSTCLHNDVFLLVRFLFNCKNRELTHDIAISEHRADACRRDRKITQMAG